MGGSGSREVEQPDDQSQQLSDEAIQLMQAMEQQEEKAREALELQVERACLPLAEAAADVTRRARREDKRTDLALQAGLAAAASRANRETESLRQEVQAIKAQWANTRRSHKRRRSRSSSADSISSRSKSRSPPRTPRPQTPRPPTPPPPAPMVDTRQVTLVKGFQTSPPSNQAWSQPAKGGGKGQWSRSNGKSGSCFKCGSPTHWSRDCPGQKGPREDPAFCFCSASTVAFPSHSLLSQGDGDWGLDVLFNEGGVSDVTGELSWGLGRLSIQEGGVPFPQGLPGEGKDLSWGRPLLGDGTGGWGPIAVVQATCKTFQVLSPDAWGVVLDFYIGLGKLERWSGPKPTDPAPHYDHYLCPFHLIFLFRGQHFLWREVSPLTFLQVWNPPTMEFKREIWTRNMVAQIEDLNRDPQGVYFHAMRTIPHLLKVTKNSWQFLRDYQVHYWWAMEYRSHPWFRKNVFRQGMTPYRQSPSEYERVLVEPDPFVPPEGWVSRARYKDVWASTS